MIDCPWFTFCTGVEGVDVVVDDDVIGPGVVVITEVQSAMLGLTGPT